MKKVAAFIIFVILVIAGLGCLRFFDDNFKYGRMRETPAVRPHERPMLVLPPGSVSIHEAEAPLRAMDAAELVSPLGTLEAPDPAYGKWLYTNYCRPCHGRNHDGHGTVGQSFHPLPGDLRSSKVQLRPDGILFKEISYGTPGGRQPPLATTISIADRWQIIAYMKSLGSRP